MKLIRSLLISLVIILSACGFVEDTVNSSELKTTKAGDLKLEADIIEYHNSDEVEIGAQLRTAKGDAAINFDSGETLKINQGNQYIPNSAITLGNNDWINLDRDYEGSIDKSEDQTYAITYTDSDNDITTITVQSSFSVEFRILNNVEVDGFAELEWDRESVIGDLRIETEYLGGRSSGGSSRGVQNTGIYVLELEDENGTGTISLEHITYYNDLPGFKESLITIYNIYSVSVNFTGNAQSLVNYGEMNRMTQKRLVDQVSKLRDDCSMICKDDEVHYLWVDGEKYSCCQE